MKGLFPYARYKDTGVEWIGEIPEHWSVLPLKRLAKICRGQEHKPQTDSSDVYPVYGSGGVFTSTAQFLYDGPSVLLGRKGTVDKPFFVEGRFWAVDTVFYTVPENCVNPKFLYYLSLTIPFSLYSSDSARPSMTEQDLGSHLLPLPDLEEQARIVEFLDIELEKIDVLIDQNEQLMSLVQEKHEATVLHAVSKGCNQNVNLKDSGLSSVGCIPSHWSMTKVGSLCAVGKGATPDRGNSTYWLDGSIPWIDSGKLGQGRVVQSDQFLTARAVRECSLRVIKPDTVLLAITGDGKTRGQVAINDVELTVNQHIAHLTPRKKEMLCSAFLCAWLYANYQNIRSDSLEWPSARSAVSCEDIRAFPLVLPPLDEQIVIGEFVSRNVRYVRDLQESISARIAFLKERRQALVHSSVTGKFCLLGGEWVGDQNVLADLEHEPGLSFPGASDSTVKRSA